MSRPPLGIDIPTVWRLGSTKHRKMIHRPQCRHARQPYVWAGQISERELVDKIADLGPLAVEHNAGCYFCTTYLYWKLKDLHRASANNEAVA